MTDDRRFSGIVRTVSPLAAAGLLGGLTAGLLVVWLVDADDNPDASTPIAMCHATQVADQGLPSVVTISATNGPDGGTGTGSVIEEDGYIVTNDHVIAVAADGGSVSVRYLDGATSDATIVGRDPDTDIAVIKVDDAAEGRPLISVGDSDLVQVGQPVVALGAPLGLTSTVTSGIVSALDRYLPLPGADDSSAFLIGAIQTDASINPGNSGGPLVDCDSHMVGINTAIITVPDTSGNGGGGSVGLGFAIPSDMAMPIIDELITTGVASHPTFGLHVRVLPSDVTGQLGLSAGLYVDEVIAAGPAEKAGLRVGDVITSIDDQPATSPDALVLRTLTGVAGDEVSVDYLREGRQHSTDITLASP